MKEDQSATSRKALDPRDAAHLLDHILVGVGGSEPSLSALRHALLLARGSASRLQVLIVEELHLSEGAALAHGDILGRLLEEAHALMQVRWDETEREVRNMGRAHDRELEVLRETGRVSDRIVAAAKDASLLVLGKRGCREEHGGLLGSNTELVLRRTHKPVLLAPEEFQPPQQVLVAYGGKPMGEVALSIGLEASQALQVPLKVLTVEDETERRKAISGKARIQLVSLGGSATFEADSGRVVESILRRSDPETLLVMGAYGHSRTYRLLLGSVTEEVMRLARGPVLLTGK